MIELTRIGGCEFIPRLPPDDIADVVVSGLRSLPISLPDLPYFLLAFLHLRFNARQKNDGFFAAVLERRR